MPYERFERDELILRDELALDRTRLANERTLLSYARTGLMIAVTGATAVKVFGEGYPAIVIWGWAFVVAGVIIGLFGVWRFFTMAKQLNRLRKVVDRQRATDG